MWDCCSICRNTASECMCIVLKFIWRACYFGLCYEGCYILKGLRQWAVSKVECTVFVYFIWNLYPQTVLLIFKINLNLILFYKAFAASLSFIYSVLKSYFLTCCPGWEMYWVEQCLRETVLTGTLQLVLCCSCEQLQTVVRLPYSELSCPCSFKSL